MQWFAALIPTYPEIQARAHAELDRVVGRGRLPTVEDEKNMPYIHAIIKVSNYFPPFFSVLSDSYFSPQEVERCHNPFWLGTPHVNTQDFTFQGQFIPKDTVVVLNTVCKPTLCILPHDSRCSIGFSTRCIMTPRAILTHTVLT